MSNLSWRAWVAAVALVIFGFALGVGATTYVGVKRLRENLNNPGAARGLADRALDRIHQNISEELKLTAEEREQLQKTLTAGAANLRAIRQRSLRESRAEIDRLVKQISDELPEAKRGDFRRHLTKQLMWLNNPRRDGPPPPGAGPGPAPDGERPPRPERKE